jgi:3-mercaptopyruvate sulfurtransferase SseA
MLRTFGLALVGAGVICATPALAQDAVQLTPNLPDITLNLNGAPVTIARNPDPQAVLTGDFTRTNRACPPFCIQPASAAAGVATVAELELITFLQDHVAPGTGLLIDARLPEWFAGGTVPGAVNVPFATLDATNPYRTDILLALGAVDNAGTLDFSGAMDLMVFCNGPWSDQSTRMIANLIAAGYPADRITWYRGGLQDWLMLGLTTTAPEGSG